MSIIRAYVSKISLIEFVELIPKNSIRTSQISSFLVEFKVG